MSFSVQRIESRFNRSAVLAHLRQILPALEARASASSALSFGIPAIDRHLPGGGLSRDALHEFTAPAAIDMPAAFGFIAVLLGHTLLGEKGPALLALSGRDRVDFGQPYAHGLGGLGIPPGRLLLLETATDVQVLWAIEEALRLRAVSAVAGWLGGKLDLKASRRLQIAAEGSDAFLLLLRPPQADEPTRRRPAGGSARPRRPATASAVLRDGDGASPSNAAATDAPARGSWSRVIRS
jgi:protein ImuA